MKKFLSLSLVALAAIPGAFAQEAFTVEGRYAGSDPYLYLQYPGAKGTYVKDSVAVRNGQFRFAGTIEGPVYASLSGKMKSRSMDDPNIQFFFLEPGKTTIAAKENAFKEMAVTGGAVQADFNTVNKEKAPIKKQWEPFFKSLDSINKIDNFKAQEFKSGLKPYYADMEKIDMAYIDAHPGTYLSAFLLRGYSYSLPTEKLQAYFDQFPASIKNGMAKGIGDELERRKIGVPGTEAYAFATSDINGQPFQLADYRGKYVLIDFWASWCLPCRKGNPHLKKLYAQYKEKGLEIIGVSDDDSKPEAWRKAVNDDGIGIWKHVLRGMDREKIMAGIYNPTDISKRFGIASLPTKVLIDPQGKIIGRFEGGDRDDAKMDAQLESLLGGK
ncbi:redoxin domain-containing protein [Chitinophaga sp. NPDC101104]|uniref:redoxin domain-containing protein n=1 Tax=Chitinophaga sp. NPDC101104 TaxID=3390561 RepID=UPI003D085E78